MMSTFGGAASSQEPYRPEKLQRLHDVIFSYLDDTDTCLEVESRLGRLTKKKTFSSGVTSEQFERLKALLVTNGFEAGEETKTLDKFYDRQDQGLIRVSYACDDEDDDDDADDDDGSHEAAYETTTTNTGNSNPSSCSSLENSNDENANQNVIECITKTQIDQDHFYGSDPREKNRVDIRITVNTETSVANVPTGDADYERYKCRQIFSKDAVDVMFTVVGTSLNSSGSEDSKKDEKLVYEIECELNMDFVWEELEKVSADANTIFNAVRTLVSRWNPFPGFFSPSEKDGTNGTDQEQTIREKQKQRLWDFLDELVSLSKLMASTAKDVDSAPDKKRKREAFVANESHRKAVDTMLEGDLGNEVRALFSAGDTSTAKLVAVEAAKNNPELNGAGVDESEISRLVGQKVGQFYKRWQSSQ
jgi:hypothetical protein